MAKATIPCLVCQIVHFPRPSMASKNSQGVTAKRPVTAGSHEKIQTGLSTTVIKTTLFWTLSPRRNTRHMSVKTPRPRPRPRPRPQAQSFGLKHSATRANHFEKPQSKDKYISLQLFSAAGDRTASKCSWQEPFHQRYPCPQRPHITVVVSTHFVVI